MTFLQITAILVGQIGTWVKARLNALKTKVEQVSGQVSTLTTTVNDFVQTTTTALADRYTKAETDTKISTAVSDSATALTTAYQTADAIVLAQALAAARANVRKSYRKTITNGVPFGIGDAMPSASGLENGSYQIFFDGPSTDTATAQLYNESGVIYSQAVSNGDVYILNILDGVITDGIFVNNESNARFNLIQSQQDAQDAKILALESVPALDLSTYATISQAEGFAIAAMEALKNELLGLDYTDPN
jgi:uncharacterized protein YoxC